MGNDDQFKFWDAIRSGVGPSFISWFVDLSRAVMFWVSIGVLHLIQLLILSFGWSPWFVHWIDILEEWVVFASVAAFLIHSAFSYIWATYRSTVGELK